MGIFKQLMKDHELAKTLAYKIIDGDTNLFEEFHARMVAHSKVEELILYNRLKRSKKMEYELMQAFKEHIEFTIRLDELAAVKERDLYWLDKFEKSIRYLEHHIDEEEQELFMHAEELLTEQEMMNMGRQFNERSKSVLKTLMKEKVDRKTQKELHNL